MTKQLYNLIGQVVTVYMRLPGHDDWEDNYTIVAIDYSTKFIMLDNGCTSQWINMDAILSIEIV